MGWKVKGPDALRYYINCECTNAAFHILQMTANVHLTDKELHFDTISLPLLLPQGSICLGLMMQGEWRMDEGEAWFP